MLVNIYAVCMIQAVFNVGKYLCSMWYRLIANVCKHLCSMWYRLMFVSICAVCDTD